MGDDTEWLASDTSTTRRRLINGAQLKTSCGRFTVTISDDRPVVGTSNRMTVQQYAKPARFL